MSGQNRNDGSGLGNYELRFGNAGQAIGEARRKIDCITGQLLLKALEIAVHWLLWVSLDQSKF